MGGHRQDLLTVLLCSISMGKALLKLIGAFQPKVMMF